jgi:ornithine cyclodeaminase/alanine dehydrogenase-like protein (mu-crystallin family)
VVTDLVVQARAVGESQHFAEEDPARLGSLVELGAILAGLTPGPTPAQLTVYDSTGTGFQDAAAAAALINSPATVPGGLTLEW